jgi:hypothetical protein
VWWVAIIAVVSAGDAQAERPWSRELRFWIANDGWADIRDGERRSDEGATASLGTRWVERLDSERHARFDVAYYLFTEPGGDLRSDWFRLDLLWGHRGEPAGWFDLWVGEAGIGLQMTGDLGGASLQNDLHRLTASDIDLTFATGLQSTYTGELRATGVLNARGRAERRDGWLLFAIEGDLALPAGNTGLGWAGADFRARVGPARSWYIDLGLRLALQWRLGGALGFNGAPIDGGVVIPSLAVGWAGNTWQLQGGWERNHLGTERGLGTTRENESVTVSVARRW